MAAHQTSFYLFSFLKLICLWYNLQGWLPSKKAQLKFVFDGDEVHSNSTPSDLDMEEEDVIDVHYC